MKGSDVASASVRPELIERVESGNGADRETEGRIWCALYGFEFVMWDGAGCVYRDANGINHIDRVHVRPWTSSLDAVVSLLEQRLPTITDNSAADFLAASIDEMMVRGWRPSEPNGPQICRSVLAALLRALQDVGTLADAHSKSPSRPAMPKEEDTHG